MTTDTAAAPAKDTAADEPPADTRISKEDRWGWWAVGGIMVVLAATWVPRLNLPYGDNHMGRIISRYALHLANLQEKGLVGSHFTSDWAPYAYSSYAHHPPLLNFLTALFGSLPGNQPYEVWLSPFLLALLVVPAGAALLRALGMRWSATLLAVGLLAATTFFWVYSPIMFDLGPMLLISAIVLRVRKKGYNPPRRLLVVGCVAAILATTISWPGVAFAGAMGISLLIGRRRIDRVVLWVGGSMIVGLALSLLFVVGISGLSRLTKQTELRTGSGATFTTTQFVERQGHNLSDLFPHWYLVLLAAGTLFALWDRRTRLYMAFAALFTAFWVFGLNNGAYVHDYWDYPVMIMGLVGMGVLIDRVIGWLPRLVSRAGIAVAAVCLVAWLGFIAFGPINRDRVDRPVDAGRLVEEYGPGPNQQFAWVAGGGLATPRWLVLYWNMPLRSLTPEIMDRPVSEAKLHDVAKPDDLVLMDLRKVPKWLPATIESQAVHTDGEYALFRVADLKAAEIPIPQ